MNKYNIFDIDNYIFVLKDNNDKKYTLNLEFININNKLEVGDSIYINDSLINEKSFYTFGPLNSEYGKQIELEKAEDILILEKDNEKIYLQRYYG